MKLLVASSFSRTTKAIQKSLAKSGFNSDDITVVSNIDDLLNELKTDIYHYIVTQYCVESADIWQLSKLINSAQFSAHSLPIYLLEESCETDIPPILAREHGFKVVALDKLGETLTAAYAHNQAAGYRRGRDNFPNNRLLIIDDDEDAAFFAFHSLKDEYEVDMAYDGLRGYKLWENKRHDLVLLDLMLPVMMGDIVLEKIMEIDQNQPIIIITGHDKPDNHKEFLLNGASEYLCKPYTMADLKVQCRTILHRAKLIYQTHYLRTKLDSLGNLFWLLDQAILINDDEKTKQIMSAIKGMLPNNLSDDYKLKLKASDIYSPPKQALIPNKIEDRKAAFRDKVMLI
ncbi:response regulator receiver protein [Methyloglobulus morosus KoM1]|uniref:Response regulator receiver protein n=1 Tax=Methyloglobulus morosus KoM1 TaxID=1116472 RepID=V5BEI2_9GAMM|nr:response regulator [Methyloglobulus morosus]ESS71680.1 response regulator receiver protein [Methyloglobulus morosus KoM1]